MRMLWLGDTEDYYLVRGVTLRERLKQEMRLAVSEVCPLRLRRLVCRDHVLLSHF